MPPRIEKWMDDADARHRYELVFTNHAEKGEADFLDYPSRHPQIVATLKRFLDGL